ncbi:hypothetical protein [Dyella caseinilytica]|uniref:Lipoprotein n=1 Tax=Dyella caseinilytica TaxID=1849581 RepID=A0ABX7GTE0_9GAMM|nr:hypothetical protein [Dyella caseinilytica]QRN53323.1 hypothetical protein ISN74_18140 [Dyella caseinilytica]GGA13231.1 hypothetical protein GCM10011408_38520 [Dyella caseinilytica]
MRRAVRFLVLLGVCFLAACQTPESVKTASEVASKPQVMYRVSYAGQQIYAGHWYNLNVDCSINNIPEGTILKPPAHGVAQFKVIEDYSNYSSTNLRSPCNKQKSKSLALFYTPEKGYTGDDSVLVKVVSPPTMFGQWNYQIRVEPAR